MREESDHIKGLHCVCPVAMRFVMREENAHIKGGRGVYIQSVLIYSSKLRVDTTTKKQKDLTVFDTFGRPMVSVRWVMAYKVLHNTNLCFIVLRSIN